MACAGPSAQGDAPADAVLQQRGLLSCRRLLQVRFAPQIDQGIPILSYKAGQEDRELLKLEAYLAKLLKQENPIDYNAEYFKLKSYSEHVSSKELFEFLHTDYQNKRLT